MQSPLFLRLFPWLRFAIFWTITFAVWYGGSLLFYTFYVATSNPLILVASQVFPPILLLIMSILFFRGVSVNDWPARFFTAFLWIGLALVASAALMQPVYGYPWTVLFSKSTFLGQAMNLVAVFIGAFVGENKKNVQLPPKFGV